MPKAHQPITRAEVRDLLAYTVRYLDDPQDPSCDYSFMAFVMAARASLTQCEEVMATWDGVTEKSAQTPGDFIHAGELILARKVARHIREQLQQWGCLEPGQGGEQHGQDPEREAEGDQDGSGVGGVHPEGGQGETH